MARNPAMSQDKAAMRTQVRSIIQKAPQGDDWLKYESELRHCLKVDPQFDATYYALAKVSQAHRKTRMAEDYLRQSLKLPDSGMHADILILLGRILFESDRLEEAESACESVLA